MRLDNIGSSMEIESNPGDNGAFWEGRWKSGHTPWDHGQHAPPFAEFVENEAAPEGDILIPGAGSGNDVRFFAGLGARVTGLDVAPSAIQVAQERNPHPRARYILGDILNPAPELLGQFDWVIEHTCLCALDPKFWKAYAASIPMLLRPGGHFLALFYRNPHDDEGPPFGIDEPTIASLFESTFTLLRAWVPKQAYESRIGREEIRWYRLNG
jgi:SAM-dependent methyltransferase